MRYASIDLETTGLDPKLHSIIEIAIIVDDTEHPEVPIQELPTFKTLVPHKRMVWDMVPLQMHSKNGLLSELMDCNHNIGTIKDYLKTFFDLHFEGSVIGAGKNFVGFDKPFLLEFLHVNFLHRALDPGPMYSLAIDKAPPNLDVCLKRAGIDSQTNHRAYDDAKAVVQLIRHKLCCV